MRKGISTILEAMLVVGLIALAFSIALWPLGLDVRAPHPHHAYYDTLAELDEPVRNSLAVGEYDSFYALLRMVMPERLVEIERDGRVILRTGAKLSERPLVYHYFTQNGTFTVRIW